MRYYLKAKITDKNFIYKIDGEINLQNEGKIKKDIIDALQKNADYQDVYINLENVTFIDSSGLGMLVYINSFLHSSRKVLHLISPSPDILKILRLGAFDKLFKIEKQ
jgi:anti-anti-sigma factor